MFEVRLHIYKSLNYLKYYFTMVDLQLLNNMYYCYFIYM